MKYFCNKKLLDHHIKMLRKLTALPRNYRLINYNDNYIEVVQYEKSIKRKELCDFDKWEGVDINKLPLELRKIIRSKDFLAFHVDYKEYELFKKRISDVEIYNDREERLKKFNRKFTDEEFYKYVVLGVPIPTSEYKKAKDSCRRAYKTVDALIKCNIEKFKHFITLTFAEEKNKEKHRGYFKKYINNPKDFEEVKKTYQNWMKNLREFHERRGVNLYYMTVWELQKNGNYHFHILMSSVDNEVIEDNPQWLDYDYRQAKQRCTKRVKSWDFGKSEIEEIKSQGRIGKYISKYLLKTFKNVTEGEYKKYLGQRKYFPSKNLSKPVVSDITYDEYIQKQQVLKVGGYYTSYTNPYNDSKIHKTIKQTKGN